MMNLGFSNPCHLTSTQVTGSECALQEWVGSHDRGFSYQGRGRLQNQRRPANTRLAAGIRSPPLGVAITCPPLRNDDRDFGSTTEC